MRKMRRKMRGRRTKKIRTRKKIGERNKNAKKGGGWTMSNRGRG